MRLGIHFVAHVRADAAAGEPWTAFERLVVAADRAGFARITTGDVQGGHLDWVSALSRAAQVTDRAELGPHVTNPLTRDPGLMATTLATLDLLSGQRCFAVLGRGDGAAVRAGMLPASASRLERYLRAVRELLSTGTTTYEERRITLPWPAAHAPRVRLAIVAEGPRMLELAGAVADEVYIGLGLTPEVVQRALAHLAGGAKRTGRTLDDISVWWEGRCAVAPAAEDAHTSVLESLSSMGNHALRGSPTAKLVPRALRPALAEYHARYDHGQKGDMSGRGRNVDLMLELGLRDYFAERFGIIGTPADAASRLAELRSRGIEQVHLGAGAPDPATVTLLADELAAHGMLPTGVA